MGAKAVVVVFPTEKSAKILKWKVKEGTLVNIGRVILLYDVGSIQGQEEYKKLKATHVGTVRKLLAKEGEIVQPGAALLELEECTHPTVFKDMCAECGLDLRKEELNEPNASVPMVHSIPELKVSEKEAKILGKADETRLLKHRKLVLLVDLDQTLIHTTNDNIPANLKDVYHFQLYGSVSPWYHTRLRPGTHKFLSEMSDYYELHICTFGARNYAHMIAMFLDPDGKFFSHRILSRDECFDPNSKTANLKALFPCGDNMVCIIDDREDVWNYASNLIHVKPYHFFQHTGDINAPPGLDKHESDDKEGFDFTNIDNPTEIHTTVKTKSDDGLPGEDGEEVGEKDSDDLGDRTKDTFVTPPDDVPASNGRVDDDKAESGGSDTMDVCSVTPECRTEGELASRSEISDNTDVCSKVGELTKDLKNVISVNDVSSETKSKSGSADEDNENVTMSVVQHSSVPCAGSESGGGGNVETTKSCVEDSSVERSISADGDNANITQLALSHGLVSLEPSENVQISSISNVADNSIIGSPDSASDSDKLVAEEETKGFVEPDAETNKSDEDLVELADSDDYLLYLEEILKMIHTSFFEHYDKLNATTVPDLKKVIPEVRSKVLAGKRLVFSGLVPTHVALEQSRAYLVARSLGAEVTQDLEPNTTHLIAVRLGTAKVNAARRAKRVLTVTPNWLWSCAERWEHVEERLFPLGPNGAAWRHPPAHCASPEHVPSGRGQPAVRRRTPSGRFMDSINPLMSFSMEDIEDMDKEVEDIFNESESDGEGEPEAVEQTLVFVKRSDAESGDESSASFSDNSLSDSEDTPCGWGGKRPAPATDESDEEMPSVKFRRGEALPSEDDQDESQGSMEPPDELDDGEWNMMGAALEREFLSGDGLD